MALWVLLSSCVKIFGTVGPAAYWCEHSWHCGPAVHWCEHNWHCGPAVHLCEYSWHCGPAVDRCATTGVNIVGTVGTYCARIEK